MKLSELNTLITDIVRKYPKAELVYVGEIGGAAEVTFCPHPDESLLTIDASIQETSYGSVIHYDNEIWEV